MSAWAPSEELNSWADLNVLESDFKMQRRFAAIKMQLCIVRFTWISRTCSLGLAECSFPIPQRNPWDTHKRITSNYSSLPSLVFWLFGGFVLVEKPEAHTYINRKKSIERHEIFGHLNLLLVLCLMFSTVIQLWRPWGVFWWLWENQSIRENFPHFSQSDFINGPFLWETFFCRSFCLGLETCMNFPEEQPEGLTPYGSSDTNLH